MDKDWYNSLPHVSWPTHCLVCNQPVTGSKVNEEWGLSEQIPCGHVQGTYKVKPNA